MAAAGPYPHGPLPQPRTRAELARRCGSTDQMFGVEAVTLSDGAGRGVRCLDFRTGAGLNFRVAVDRAMDLASAEFEGVNLGWRSAVGIRHPALNNEADEGAMGWLRSFSGLLTTCGLDHIMGPEREDAAHFNYPGRPLVDFPLHGRIANTPARLRGYGADWDGDRCVLWCEGDVRQSAVFGENLVLRRRIETVAGETRIKIRDRVVNEGFATTPHMLLYHINLGYPLLDAGAEFAAPVREVLWASHAETLESQGVGWRLQSGPRDGFREQVFEHLLVGAGNTARVGLLNPIARSGRGLGLTVEFDRTQLPCLMQWQAYQPGLYALGIEPSTHHALGRAFARERGETIGLRHGEARDYSITLDVLADRSALDRFAAEVLDRSPSLAEDFARPTGRWAEPLR